MFLVKPRNCHPPPPPPPPLATVWAPNWSAYLQRSHGPMLLPLSSLSDWSWVTACEVRIVWSLSLCVSLWVVWSAVSLGILEGPLFSGFIWGLWFSVPLGTGAVGTGRVSLTDSSVCVSNVRLLKRMLFCFVFLFVCLCVWHSLLGLAVSQRVVLLSEKKLAF